MDHKSRKKSLLALGATAALLLFAAPAALGAPGELDPAFGSGGKATIDFGGDDVANGLALQPDGRIVLGGTTEAADRDFAFARLGSNGVLDTSFGVQGMMSVSVGISEEFAGLALQPDGKIVAAGDAVIGGNFDMVAARLLDPQGTLDPTYGSGGTSNFSFAPGSADFARGMALQPDGRIVIAGNTDAFDPNNDFAVVRFLNPQGTPDPAFASGSGSYVSFGPGTRDFASDVAVQPDGGIVIAGDTITGAAPGNDDFAVVRLRNPQGDPDPAFGGGSGKAVVDFGTDDDYGQALALQPDGKIVVVGGSNGKLALTRLLPDGALDGSFAGNGKDVLNVPTDALDVAVQADGKIVLAAEEFIGAQRQFIVVRLQPNGSLDTTFGNNGVTKVGFGGTDEFATQLALQPDGKIVAAGWAGENGAHDFAVARLQGDPGGAAVGPRRCAGKQATIIGTNAKDKLKGTKKKDVIAALGGKDLVKGKSGNDLICGGKGNDKLLGGKGKDKLLGGPGKDKLLGGPGKDKLLGGPGKDTLKGGPGKDSVKLRRNTSVLSGPAARGGA